MREANVNTHTMAQSPLAELDHTSVCYYHERQGMNNYLFESASEQPILINFCAGIEAVPEIARFGIGLSSGSVS